MARRGKGSGVLVILGVAVGALALLGVGMSWLLRGSKPDEEEPGESLVDGAAEAVSDAASAVREGASDAASAARDLLASTPLARAGAALYGWWTDDESDPDEPWESLEDGTEAPALW